MKLREAKIYIVYWNSYAVAKNYVSLTGKHGSLGWRHGSPEAHTRLDRLPGRWDFPPAHPPSIPQGPRGSGVALVSRWMGAYKRLADMVFSSPSVVEKLQLQHGIVHAISFNAFDDKAAGRAHEVTGTLCPRVDLDIQEPRCDKVKHVCSTSRICIYIVYCILYTYVSMSERRLLL